MKVSQDWEKIFTKGLIVRRYEKRPQQPLFWEQNNPVQRWAEDWNRYLANKWLTGTCKSVLHH
jgi:hypothetical protein